MHIPTEILGNGNWKIKKEILRKHTARNPRQIIVADSKDKQYLVVYAENDIQRFYIERAIKQQKIFSENGILGKMDQFAVNMPVFYGYLLDGFYAIYQYFDNLTTVSNRKKIERFLKEIYSNHCEEVNISEKGIDEIIEGFKEAWPREFEGYITELPEYKRLIALLSREKVIRCCFQHGDFTKNNILEHDNKIWIMDFEFSMRSQPIGFDLLDYSRSVGKELSGIPYSEINQTKYDLQNGVNKYIDNYYIPVKRNRPLKDFKHSISDNLIYNRADVMGIIAETIILTQGEINYKVDYSLKRNSAELLVWLKDIPSAVLQQAVKHIFSKHYQVLKIEVKFASANIDDDLKLDNNWVIAIPKTKTELWNRVTKKGRYNIRSQERRMSDIYGEISIENYTANNCAVDIIETYFKWKKVTHGYEYGLSPKEYIKKYYVTDIMVLNCGKEMVSVLFYNRNKEIAYLENLSYNTNMAQFSPGLILYAFFLERLIDVGIKLLFLGNGKQEYKKRFGSQEFIVYTGEIYRNSIVKVSANLFSFMKKCRRWLLNCLQKKV